MGDLDNTRSVAVPLADCLLINVSQLESIYERTLAETARRLVKIAQTEQRKGVTFNAAVWVERLDPLIDAILDLPYKEYVQVKNGIKFRLSAHTESENHHTLRVLKDNNARLRAHLTAIAAVSVQQEVASKETHNE